MGCKGSKEGGCCPRPRSKKRQTTADPCDQELASLNAGHSPGDPGNNAGSPKKHQQDWHRLQREHEEAAKAWEGELARRLSEQAEVLKRDHDEQCKEFQRSHDQEKTSMMEAFHTSQAALQAQLDELNSQLRSYHEKMKRVEESVLNRDYKRHIQEYGSPGQFWEQELQSLHFVIEMKNERLHELDKKLLRLQMVMEKNLSLEEKVTTLQQDNEDLRVQIKNHASFTRQLSEEVLAMQEAIEREAQARQQLHREKEELLYRVLNDQALPAFQLSNVAAEAPLIAT